MAHLEQALEVSEKDVKDATQGVLRDLKRFQKEKEDDLNRYMVSLSCEELPCQLTLTDFQIAYARCHVEWARKNLQTWTEARDEVDKIVTG